MVMLKNKKKELYSPLYVFRNRCDDLVSILSRGWKFFSSPPRLDRLWVPPGLLSDGCRVFFPWGWGGRGVGLTTRLCLTPRLEITWSYTSTPPVRFHGVVLDWALGQLYFTLLYFTLLYFTLLCFT
jgi:hypothetical protein